MKVGVGAVVSTTLRNAEPEFTRLKGEALSMLGKTEASEVCFRHAATVAHTQSARIWELRAVMSLVRLCQAADLQEVYAAAHTQLSEVYAWFTEGSDTLDLQEAATLLGGVEMQNVASLPHP